MEHRLDSLQREVTRCLTAIDVLRRQNVTLRVQLTDAVEQLARRPVDPEDTALRGEVDTALRGEVERILERLGAASIAGAAIDYAGFEDRFRGSSEELRDAQRRYVDLFGLPAEAGSILDIGCGRGEMLEILQEAGHTVVGVDMDADMVKVCRSKNLPVVQDDAIHYLRGVEPRSLKGIFCSQVVEHLMTFELEAVLQLGYESLRSSGVFVIETINPRSLYALGNHFFADTSHVRPVHPETLRYMCEQVGYSSTVLQECSEHPLASAAGSMPDDETGRAVAALLRTVYGFQDYAIIATK